MELKLPLFLPLLFFVASFHPSTSASGKSNSFESVPDLEMSMYTQLDGYPCVRLLNISGEIGCSNPGRGKVVAPTVQFKNANVLQCWSDQLQYWFLSMNFKVYFQVFTLQIFSFLLHLFLLLVAAASRPPPASAAAASSRRRLPLQASRVSKDPNFSRNVAGVLVEASTQVQNGLKGNSPDVKFPQAQFAPHTKTNLSGIQQDLELCGKLLTFLCFYSLKPAHQSYKRLS